MSWTKEFGKACGVLLDAIVNWLALARINPNALTLIGLGVNTVAAVLFGYATADNQRRMFFYAGLVIIGSGFFDLVDGRVARASNQVTRFGGFFDSVVDRYSDVSLFFGLLVFYARGNRFFYVVLTALVMTGAVMVSYARAGALGDRGAIEHHRHSPHSLHLAANSNSRRRPTGRHTRGLTTPVSVSHAGALSSRHQGNANSRATRNLPGPNPRANRASPRTLPGICPIP